MCNEVGVIGLAAFFIVAGFTLYLLYALLCLFIDHRISKNGEITALDKRIIDSNNELYRAEYTIRDNKREIFDKVQSYGDVMYKLNNKVRELEDKSNARKTKKYRR